MTEIRVRTWPKIFHTDKHSSALTYADDTRSSVKDKRIEELVWKLEEVAINVLKFMASNGMVANPSKTTLLILNNNSGEEIEI